MLLLCVSIDLEEVDRCKVYVVGGIVDRSSPSKVHNNNKNALVTVCSGGWCVHSSTPHLPQNLTLHRARVAGLETARLPISRFMEFTKPSPHNLNLPINVGNLKNPLLLSQLIL